MITKAIDEQGTLTYEFGELGALVIITQESVQEELTYAHAQGYIEGTVNLTMSIIEEEPGDMTAEEAIEYIQPEVNHLNQIILLLKTYPKIKVSPDFYPNDGDYLLRLEIPIEYLPQGE